VAKQLNEWSRLAQERGFKSAKEWMTSMYRGGLSESDIAQAVGLSRSGVHKLLNRLEIERRSKGGPNRR
jgi:transposase